MRGLTRRTADPDEQRGRYPLAFLAATFAFLFYLGFRIVQMVGWMVDGLLG